ncbi:MAG: FtsQ-type POTRA domain-containing protein [Tenericutes bacterium]|nr:FtsQ-type POTRA domain-containing protein [Mycoplasmatota bacterium]
MKKKVRKKFNFFKFLIFILSIYLLYIFTLYLFNIKTKNIIILNNEYYSDELIIETAGLSNYPKFLTLSKSKIKKKLLKLDLIENVRVSKKYGSIVEINISEKKILYFIRSNDLYKVSDDKNYLLDNINNVPVLINYVPEDIEKRFVNAFKTVDSNIISLISEIEYSKTSYDDERFLLYMNDGNEVYITVLKAKMLNKYIDIVKKLDNKKGILYLDSGNYFEIKK